MPEQRGASMALCIALSNRVMPTQQLRSPRSGGGSFLRDLSALLLRFLRGCRSGTFSGASSGLPASMVIVVVVLLLVAVPAVLLVLLVLNIRGCKRASGQRC